jgi:hypothetical protein
MQASEHIPPSLPHRRLAGALEHAPRQRKPYQSIVEPQNRPTEASASIWENKKTAATDLPPRASERHRSLCNCIPICREVPQRSHNDWLPFLGHRQSVAHQLAVSDVATAVSWPGAQTRCRSLLEERKTCRDGRGPVPHLYLQRTEEADGQDQSKH